MEATPRRTVPHSFFQNLPQVEVQIVRGRAKNLTRAVTSTVFLIGGGTECDLVLGDARFEGVHSYLLRTPERVILRRLADAPELTVNDEAVEMAELSDGSRFAMGPYEFRVNIQWPTRRLDGPEYGLGDDAREELAEDATTKRGMAVVGQLVADIRRAFLRPSMPTAAGVIKRRGAIRFRPDAA